MQSTSQYPSLKKEQNIQWKPKEKKEDTNMQTELKYISEVYKVHIWSTAALNFSLWHVSQPIEIYNFE